MAPPTYIISRTLDPIFAVVIGVGAAVTRIRREEMEKGRTNNEILKLALRYVFEKKAKNIYKKYAKNGNDHKY